MCPEFLLAEAKLQSSLTMFWERVELQDLYSDVHDAPVDGLGKL